MMMMMERNHFSQQKAHHRILRTIFPKWIKYFIKRKRSSFVLMTIVKWCWQEWLVFTGFVYKHDDDEFLWYGGFSYHIPIIYPIIYVDSLYTILNQAKFSVAYPLDQVVYRWHDPQVIISLISSFPFFINHYYQNDNHDHGHEHDGISAKNLRWQLVTKGSCSCRSLRSWGQSTGFRIIMVISGSSSNSMNVLACSSCSLPRSFAMEEFWLCGFAQKKKTASISKTNQGGEQWPSAWGKGAWKTN